MDKVFDVLNEENRRFAKMQEEAEQIPPVHDRAKIESIDILATKRILDEKKDFRMTLCS